MLILSEIIGHASSQCLACKNYVGKVIHSLLTASNNWSSLSEPNIDEMNVRNLCLVRTSTPQCYWYVHHPRAAINITLA